MTDFMKMDVFFYVTTIAVVLLTLGAIVALVYVLSIIRDVKYIIKKARAGTDALSGDLEEFRNGIKNRGAKFGSLIKFLLNLYNKSGK